MIPKAMNNDSAMHMFQADTFNTGKLITNKIPRKKH